MLCELPTEILIQIFDYLEPIFLLRSVAEVCKRFGKIILDRNYGRLNYYQSLYSLYPSVQDVPILRHMGKIRYSDWMALGGRFKSVCTRWNGRRQVDTFCSSYGSVVDTVHMLKNSGICVVGNRHKCIDLWDVRKTPMMTSTMANAHSGWVSCLDSYETETFFSGGWDSVVTLWKVREHSCDIIWSSKCKRGVMSVACRPDLVVVASFSPVLMIMDPRSGQKTKHEIHSKAIFDVKLVDNYAVSIARDRTMSAFDIRMLKIVEKITVTEKYQWPKCLTLRDNIVYVGDTNGYVHLFDKNNRFSEFQKIPVFGPKAHISSIYADWITFVCGGSDRFMKVVAPSQRHFVIKEIQMEHAITSISCENDILALGKTNGYVEIHKPGRKNGNDMPCT